MNGSIMGLHANSLLTWMVRFHGKKDAFRRIFQDRAYLDEVDEGFIEFSTGTGRFGGYDVLRDRGAKKP